MDIRTEMTIEECFIVVFYDSVTAGNVVVGGTGTLPTLSKPTDVAFDSSMNLYVVDESNQQVVKYVRL